MNNLLEIKNLSVCFDTSDGLVRAVDGVSLNVGRGEVVALVGGSGSGKTVTALSVLKLLDRPGRISGGEIFLDGVDVLKMKDDEVRKIRGAKASMIFQEPMTSLNPVFTIGDQIIETMLVHKRAARKSDARDRAVELLELVKIHDASSRLSAYPHELSGGQRQRVMIAMSLACNPRLLIADEPTTALDVTVQAQILELLGDLRRRLGLSILFITHDFGIVAQFADRVYVMQHGKVVEEGDVFEIFSKPKHEYTQKLLCAVPVF